MIRTSTFTIATLAAIAAVSLASTGASAHFSGGGGSFAGGSFSPGAGHISTSGSYAHLPVAAGIARSSVIARIPKTGHHIPTISQIAQFPRMPLPPTPPKPPMNPNNNNPKSGSGPVVPVDLPGDVPADVPVDVVAGAVTGTMVGADSQTAQTASNANCNCLTKQVLDDGSLLFRDICSKEAVLVTAAELKAQAHLAH